MTAPQRDVRVTIDRLVLHGFEARDADEIARAVELELARLVSAAPPAAESRRIARVEGGSLDARPGASATSIGESIARAVHGGIAR